MKPGIRKRQKELEKYLYDAWNSDYSNTVFDDEFVRCLIIDGVYINKEILMGGDYRPLWVQLLMFLEKKQSRPLSELGDWFSLLIEQGIKFNEESEYLRGTVERITCAGNFNTLKCILEHTFFDYDFEKYCLISEVLSDNVTSEEIEIIQYLIAKGNKLDEALICAVSFRSEEVVDLLINSGANINYQNSKGISALMWAFGQPASKANWWPALNAFDIAEKLLRLGADPNLKSNQNRTCRSILNNMNNNFSYSDETLSSHYALLEKYGG